MKICIFGAGAVGSILAGRMIRGGAAVTIVARGAHLEAIQKKGLKICDRNGDWKVKVESTYNTQSLGQQDLLILGVKAHTLAPALAQIEPLVGAHTTVMHIVNGIPWWFFHGITNNPTAEYLDSVDPGGIILKTFGPEKALGCVVHIASNIIKPGVVEHNAGGTFLIGEPNNSESDRVKRVVAALSPSGLRIQPTTDIRSAIWSKLYSNITGNPLSVLLEAGFEGIFGAPGMRDVLYNITKEASSVARAFGSNACPDIDKRLNGLATLGSAKSSTLQDFEAGKSLELDALVGSVSELGRLAKIATPTIDLVYALTCQKALLAGLYSRMENKANSI